MDTACKYSRLYRNVIFMVCFCLDTLDFEDTLCLCLYTLYTWTWSWQTLGDGEGKRGLACCSPWGRKKSDMTGRLNNNPLYWLIFNSFLDIYQLFYFLMFHLHFSVPFSIDYHFARQPFLFLFSLLSFMLWCLAFFVKRIFSWPKYWLSFILKLYKLCKPWNSGIEFVVSLGSHLLVIC